MLAKTRKVEEKKKNEQKQMEGTPDKAGFHGEENLGDEHITLG